MIAPALLLALTGCFSGSDTADTGGGGTDTSDTGEDVVDETDYDPLVASWIPDDYVTTGIARVVFLGDSITNGNGASNRQLSYPKLLKDNDDETWPAGAEFDFPALFDEAPEVIDEALAGATTASLVAKQLPHVTEDLGDTVSGKTAVVVTIAGNDVQGIMFNTSKTEETTENILENLGEFYDYFQDPVRFPDGSQIYLANVYEPSDGVGQADECFYGLNLENVLPTLDYVNNATLEHAQDRNVAWIDMRGHFLGHGFHAGDEDNAYHQADDPSLWFADDCIHPNDRGHHEIRRLMWYAIARQPWPGDVSVEVAE
jgi:lysophospholipase L1-like esterase